MRRTVLSRRRSAPCQPLRCLAERDSLLLSTRCARRRPWGSPFAAFIPSGRLWSFATPLIPHAVPFNVRPWLFLPGVWLSTTYSSAGPMPRHLHPLVPDDSQNGALNTQLPGFVQPNDLRRTMPSFHGAPRCRPGLFNTCCFQLPIVSLSLAPIGILMQPGAQPT